MRQPVAWSRQAWRKVWARDWPLDEWRASVQLAYARVLRKPGWPVQPESLAHGYQPEWQRLRVSLAREYRRAHEPWQA